MSSVQSEGAGPHLAVSQMLVFLTRNGLSLGLVSALHLGTVFVTVVWGPVASAEPGIIIKVSIS